VLTDQLIEKFFLHAAHTERKKSSTIRGELFCIMFDKLQAKGTKSAKRKLKLRRRKESRFAANVSYCISKRLGTVCIPDKANSRFVLLSAIMIQLQTLPTHPNTP